VCPLIKRGCRGGCVN